MRFVREDVVSAHEEPLRMIEGEVLCGVEWCGRPKTERFQPKPAKINRAK